MTDGWCGGYLALVDTGILSLRITYSKDPLIRTFFPAGYVQRVETLIARISVTTNCQQMNVAMSHP